MIKRLICFIFGCRIIHKAVIGEFKTLDRLTGLPTTGHYYKYEKTKFCTRCGKTLEGK